MSWCSASSIFVICSNRIKNITTRLAPTCHCTRMRRSRVLSRRWVACCSCRFWADYTTNTSKCEFPTGTPPSRATQAVRLSKKLRSGLARMSVRRLSRQVGRSQSGRSEGERRELSPDPRRRSAIRLAGSGEAADRSLPSVACFPPSGVERSRCSGGAGDVHIRPASPPVRRGIRERKVCPQGPWRHGYRNSNQGHQWDCSSDLNRQQENTYSLL